MFGPSGYFDIADLLLEERHCSSPKLPPDASGRTEDGVLCDMFVIDMKYRIKFHIVFLLFDECSDCSDPLLAMLADVLTSGYSPSTLGLSPSRFGRSEDGMPSDTAFRPCRSRTIIHSSCNTNGTNGQPYWRSLYLSLKNFTYS